MIPTRNNARPGAQKTPADGFINRFIGPNGVSGIPTDPEAPAGARKTLRVRHTRDRFGRPLIELLDAPGPGAEMSPDALRVYAAQLLLAADTCDELATRGRDRNVTSEYPL